MNRIWGLGLACCLALLSACGGSGSAAPPVQAGPGPVQLSASYDPILLQVTLTWVPPAGTFDGFNLEGRIGTGLFSQINTTLIPSNVTRGTLTFSTPPPELQPLDFRMFVVRNGLEGAASNVAAIQLPLDAPTALSAGFVPADGGVLVTWGTPSQLADHYVLERALCDPSGNPTGPWTSLLLGNPMASQYVDTDVSEVQGYLYRVTAWRGDLASAVAGPTSRVAIPPLAPTAFAAQALPAAVNLTWINHSQTATQIQITRSPAPPGGSGILATLPASATSYQDTQVPMGFYTYGINVSDGQNTTTGPTVLGVPANAAGSPLLSISPLAGASAQVNTGALSPSGLWALGTTTPFTVFPAAWGTWTTWAPTNVLFANPGSFLALDGQSLPHALYLTSTATSIDLTHAWSDGLAWHTEIALAMAASGSTPPAFCLDKAGIPQVLMDTGTGGVIPGLTYAHKVSGAWVLEPLAAAGTSDTYNGNPRLFLDAADTPHVLVPTWTNTREYSRNADGTWAYQPLPDTRPWGGGYAFEDAVWADANTAWSFYQVMDPNNPLHDVVYAVQKVNGTWQTPVLLASFAHNGFPQGSVALSPDGTRAVVVFATTTDLRLYTQTPQGWIETLLPVTNLSYPWFKAAFDSANHLHILVKPSVYTTDLMDLHE